MPESSKLLTAIEMLKSSDNPVFREGGEEMERTVRDFVREVGELMPHQRRRVGRPHDPEAERHLAQWSRGLLGKSAYVIADDVSSWPRAEVWDEAEILDEAQLREHVARLSRCHADGIVVSVDTHRCGKTLAMREWVAAQEGRGDPGPPLRARVSVETLQAIGGVL